MVKGYVDAYARALAARRDVRRAAQATTTTHAPFEAGEGEATTGG